MHCFSAKYTIFAKNIFYEMEKLLEYYNKLIRNQTFDFQRYMHSKIDWSNRMIGLIGPRGIGKTTLLLQHIKNELPLEHTLFVTAEDFYFADHKLLDLADEFTKMGGKFLFIDEIHRYTDWSKELKLMYDYFPELKVVFSGSSILDINKGASDLSRRAVMYFMQGLSFREYLQLFHNIDMEVYSLDDILQHKVQFSKEVKPLSLFQDYLKKGYYPFALESGFELIIPQIINQTLEIDIPQYAEMNVATGKKLKQLLAIIAQSVPFKPNFSSIATMLGASRNNIADYLLYMEEAGLISQLRNETGGIRALGKVNKVYLDNTNLIYSLGSENANIGNVRETFFLNQTKLIFYVISSDAADFKINEFTFEVGGKNKRKNQIKDIENGYVVKDDIEFGFNNVVPLWEFCLMY